MGEIITENGKYKKIPKDKGRFRQCDCTVDCDYTGSAPRLIRCKGEVEYKWFRRQWFMEIIKPGPPSYSLFPAHVCEDCFQKIKDVGPPSDLQKYKDLWAKNNE